MRSILILCTVLSTAYAINVGYNYGVNNGVSIGSGVSGGQFGGQRVSGGSYSSSGFGGGLNVEQVSGLVSGVSGSHFGGKAGRFSVGSQGASGGSYGSSGFAGGLSVGQVGGFASDVQSVSGPSYSSPGLSLGGSGQSFGVSNGQADGFSAGNQGAVGQSFGASVAAPAETVKTFFSYTAPEHEFSDIGDSSQYASSLKKNLRVIFIKGPENNGLENAAIQLANSAANEQTAIYVLSKQADIGSLANKLQSLGSVNSNKPEVHFVKYRTQADAENAQHAIQSSYDSLQGPSSSHNGGSAPVLNFASNPAHAPAAQQSYSSAPVVQQSYSSAPVSQQSYSSAPVVQQSYSAAPIAQVGNAYLPAKKLL